MNCKNLFVTSVAVLAAVAGSIAFAQPSKDTKPAKPVAPAPADHKAPAGPHGDMQLPPGWTSEDMQACMASGVVGEQHANLAKGVGTWNGKCEMWMAANTPGMKSECVTICTSIMDGRFVQIDNKGNMPMGPFHGQGVNGFDNVSQKYVSTWISNMGTGIMVGTGDMTKDGKSITWNYSYNCPITKKAAVMREVESFTSDTTMTLEIFMNDPKTGKEFKHMKIDFTKKS